MAFLHTLMLIPRPGVIPQVMQADFVGAINSFNQARRRMPSMDGLLPGVLPVRPSWWPGEDNKS